jgi:cyclic pyranopterin phosphate synthase
MSMIDIGKKPTVFREATAKGIIKLKPKTLKLINEGKVKKGNIYDFAKIAGIMAAKKTSELIPLCHNLQLSTVKVNVAIENNSTMTVQATVRAHAKTGVEMEALTAVSMALLTIWDMTKQYEKNQEGQYPTTTISNIYVLAKVKQSE